MELTSAAEKRREEVANKFESLLDLANKADKTTIQLMQTKIKESLRSSLESKKYSMAGGLKGLGITVLADVIDTAAKIKRNKRQEINLPNISDLTSKRKKLEERVTRAEEKIPTLSVPHLFNVILYLEKYGLESALALILGENVGTVIPLEDEK